MFPENSRDRLKEILDSGKMDAAPIADALAACLKGISDGYLCFLQEHHPVPTFNDTQALFKKMLHIFRLFLNFQVLANEEFDSLPFLKRAQLSIRVLCQLIRRRVFSAIGNTLNKRELDYLHGDLANMAQLGNAIPFIDLFCCSSLG